MNSFLDKNGNQPPQQPSVKITLDMAENVVCGECGHDVFVEATKILKFSKLLTGTAQDAIQPIPVFLCGNCGEVLKELLPKEMQ
jgi:hypothetical protein